MTAGTTELDQGDIPLSSVMKPGDNTPRPAQGSLMSYNDSLSRLLTSVVTSDNLLEALLLGQRFSITTGTQNNGGNADRAALSIFNASNSGKSILIYNIQFLDNNAGNADHRLCATTTNPSLSTSLTPVNNKLGGASSAASVTFVATGYDPSGLTVIRVFGTQVSNDLYTLMTEKSAILLPAGSAHGIVFVPFMYANTTHYFAINANWIEF